MGLVVNVLSLFAGIGGIELGLERAGFRTVGQVELDPFCRSVLARNWPEVPKHDDVRSAPEWWSSEPRPNVGLVAGGFPCQPFSQAGLRRGIGDERWGWPWFERVVRTIRPRYVLLENVAALLRDREAFGIILADLHRLGFDAQWSVVSACAVGASHMRRRLFVVAYPRGEGLQGQNGGQAGGLDLRSPTGDLRGDWASEPDVARVADGVPPRLVRDEIKSLGNAVVPAVAEQVGRLIKGTS